MRTTSAAPSSSVRLFEYRSWSAVRAASEPFPMAYRAEE